MARDSFSFLIDTNVLIKLEPTSSENIEPDAAIVTRFHRLASGAGHQLYTHPVQLADISRDKNRSRRVLRSLLIQKYQQLGAAPALASSRLAEIRNVATDTNDWVDAHLLVALEREAVDYVVTEDIPLRRVARRCGLASRVLTVAEALDLVGDLLDRVPTPPPAVVSTVAHDLDESDRFFDSFRDDYDGFDDWLRRCKRQHRQTWVIYGPSKQLAGVCIVKEETDDPVVRDRSGRSLKVCTLKVGADFNGFRYGELLLKTVFEFARQNEFAQLFLTIFPKYDPLVALLGEFGFQKTGVLKRTGELVLVKSMRPPEADHRSLSPLAFNIRFGPHSLSLGNERAFVVPIQPPYHAALFPETEQQAGLYLRSCGNGLRKAYLSRSSTRELLAGDVLLFYRSRAKQGIRVVGVVEETVVSRTPLVLAREVGRRTVYSLGEIERMCSRAVLAILFRQSRVLDNPIGRDELLEHQALGGAPQSISRVKAASIGWLRERLGP